jgi:hypothetical protein
MATNKQTPCKECGAPAYGSLCRSHNLAALRVRKQAKASVNSVGGFNAGMGFTGLDITRCVNPTASEWIWKDREEFQAWCLANRNRMLRGTGGNWRPDAASQYWVF